MYISFILKNIYPEITGKKSCESKSFYFVLKNCVALLMPILEDFG